MKQLHNAAIFADDDAKRGGVAIHIIGACFAAVCAFFIANAAIDHYKTQPQTISLNSTEWSCSAFDYSGDCLEWQRADIFEN